MLLSLCTLAPPLSIPSLPHSSHCPLSFISIQTFTFHCLCYLAIIHIILLIHLAHLFFTTFSLLLLAYTSSLQCPFIPSFSAHAPFIAPSSPSHCFPSIPLSIPASISALLPLPSSLPILNHLNYHYPAHTQTKPFLNHYRPFLYQYQPLPKLSLV